MTDEEYSWKDKGAAVWDVLSYSPIYVTCLIIASTGVALLEGLGLSFIQPIFQVAGPNNTVESGLVTDIVISTYDFIGLNFSLETLILGVSVIMISRYTTTFIVSWMRAILAKRYEAELKKRAFRAALAGKISYFDNHGSDEILNHIITEANYSGKLITKSVGVMERLFLSLIYIVIMTIMSPSLTLLSIVILGGITVILRGILKPAVSIGEKVAEANERVQETAQAGIKGIREVKLFGKKKEMFSRFKEAIENYSRNEIRMSRNEKAIYNLYRMTAALTVFILIYVGVSRINLEFGRLGVFLLALYRLSGSISGLNSRIYRLEGFFPHFVRTQRFISDLESNSEEPGTKTVSKIQDIEFDEVSFSYGDEGALKGINFRLEENDFIGLAGKSGAGKSTIVSLICRMYNPESGEIVSSNTDIREFNLDEWRERISIVRQQAFIFNTTLEENIRLGKEDATEGEIEKVVEKSKVDEFIGDLPNGLETEIGDNGVRLSGGQRQRVAIARALLKDSDVLILDEATSDLDSGLEKEVHESIKKSDRSRITVAIAHRLSTIKNADRILTLDSGRIIEEGTHNELIDKDGKYSEMYNMQRSDEQ